MRRIESDFVLGMRRAKLDSVFKIRSVESYFVLGMRRLNWTLFSILETLNRILFSIREVLDQIFSR